MVSVYCLAYNHEPFIRDALEGFVNQKTNFKYEVIVHDDASTDGTANIIREYANRYPDIIKPIFQTENQHSKKVPIMLRFIKPLMRGKYVAACEGDDYWIDDEKLQKQVDFLENNREYIACTCNVDVIEMKDNSVRKFNSATTEYDIDLYLLLKTWGSNMHLSALMYRMDAADIIYSDKRPQFFKVSGGIGDYRLGIYLALSGKIKYLPYTVSVYRHGTPGSWSDRHASNKALIAMYNELSSIIEAAYKYYGLKNRLIFMEMMARYKYRIYKIKNKTISAAVMRIIKYSYILVNLLIRKVSNE